MKINLPFGYEFSIYFERQYKRQGVCTRSYLDANKHMILWDFDEIDLDSVCIALKFLMTRYKLPSITILQSSENHYHAYCFAKRELIEVVNILSATPFIDENFIKLGIIRGYFTLRISDKENGKLSFVKKLDSIYPDEMLPTEISITEYQTYNG